MGQKSGHRHKLTIGSLSGCEQAIQDQKALVHVLDGVSVTVAEYRWVGFVEWERVAGLFETMTVRSNF